MLNRRHFSAAMLLGSLAFAAPAFAETNVKLTLDWRFEGPAAGFLLAQDKGYFAEEGLNVTVDTGNGSVEAIPRVATGAYQFGFGDINSLIKFLDEDASQPVKAIMMVYDKPVFSVIGRKSLGITDDPKSLEGKKLGAPPPDGAFAQWPAFVEAAGIDTSGLAMSHEKVVDEFELMVKQIDGFDPLEFAEKLANQNNDVQFNPNFFDSVKPRRNLLHQVKLLFKKMLK